MVEDEDFPGRLLHQVKFIQIIEQMIILLAISLFVVKQWFDYLGSIMGQRRFFNRSSQRRRTQKIHQQS